MSTQTPDHRVTHLRERALQLHEEAADAADYHRRRQLEQAAMAFRRLAAAEATRDGRGQA